MERNSLSNDKCWMIAQWNDICHTLSGTVGRGCFSAVTSRLWQHCSFWSATTACQKVSVSSECGSAIGTCHPLLQPHQPTAANCKVNWLWVVECIIFWLVVLTYWPFPPRFSTRILAETTTASLWYRHLSATLHFVVHCTTQFADCLSHHWQQSFFCCPHWWAVGPDAFTDCQQE